MSNCRKTAVKILFIYKHIELVHLLRKLTIVARFVELKSELLIIQYWKYVSIMLVLYAGICEFVY